MGRKSLLAEIAIYVAVCAAALLGLSGVDAFEAFHSFSREHESYNLDDIILAVPVALACMILFAYFRTRELKRSNAELEASHDELQQAYERIRELSRSREQFMSVACHELKSPLISAVNALRLLEMTSDEAERKELEELALESLDSLQTLIGDVLQFTRLSHDEGVVENAPFDMGEILHSIGTLATKMAENKGLTLHMIVDDAVPETIPGNVGWVRLICLNLLGNAIKYTDSGSVTFHCGFRAEPRGELVIRIVDTGVGIPGDKLDTIFEPFEQVRSGPYEKKEGLGLGLAVVRELVKRMGGTISVESTVGEGSTFTLFLPAH